MGVYVSADLTFGIEVLKDQILSEDLLKFLVSVGAAVDPMDVDEEDLWELFYYWVDNNTPLAISFGGDLSHENYVAVGVKQFGFSEILWTPIHVADLILKPKSTPVTPEAIEALEKIRSAFPDSTSEPDLLLVTSRG